MRKSNHVSLPVLQVIPQSHSNRIHAPKLQAARFQPQKYDAFLKTKDEPKPLCRLKPIRVDPKITLTFAQFKCLQIVNYNDYLYYQHRNQKKEKKLKEQRMKKKQKYEEERASIQYFQEEDKEDFDVQDIMKRVRSNESQEHMSELKMNL